MKKYGKFLRNPGPFVLATVNPGKKKKRRARNKGKARSAKKNSVPRAVAPKAKRRNPAPKKRKLRRKNPLEIRHVIEDVPARNPGRKKRKSRKSPLSSATKNPPIMSTKRRKRSRKSRNPGGRRSHSRARSRRSRNPGKRRRTMRRRNPGIIDSFKDTVSMRNIAVGTGALTGIVGTKWTINTLISGDATGKRMFDLPGITYPTAAAPMTQAQFNEKNKLMLGVYEVVLPWAAGYLLRNQAPRFSEGLTISAVINAGVALLKGTNIGTKAGLGAFLPRGTGTFIPGVPPMLSGPATVFINHGAPVRRGTGAVVNNRWAQQTTGNGAGPFTPR